MIMPCGDNCAYCPLHSARTDAELQRAAELWYKMGTFDTVLSVEEIKCDGCADRTACEIKKCIERHGVGKCNRCAEFPCSEIEDMLQKVEDNKTKYKEFCTDSEYALFCKAFFEKEANLKKL